MLEVFSFIGGAYYLFEAKTYEELFEILKNEKKIRIANKYECENILKSYGYFNLINNYKKEIEGTLKDEIVSISDLVYLRELDNDLQSLIFKNLIKIETCFKSHLSYHLANNFGVSRDNYTDPLHYHDFEETKKIFEDIEEKKHIKFHEPPGKHYLDKYNDLPPWVYLKHIPFGDTINIYKSLKQDDKVSIIDSWIYLHNFSESEKIIILQNMLVLTKDFRNTIAHGGRLLNYKTRKKIDINCLTKVIKKKILDKRNLQKYQKSFLMLLISILILLPTYRDRSKFVTEIRRLYNDYIQEGGNHFAEMFLSVSGLPDNFISILQDISVWEIPTV